MGVSVRTDGASLQIAFLTGQSDPESCALSMQQQHFLQQLQGPGRRLIDCNYPYRSASPTYRHMPLWRASVSNARQYLAARAARVADADRMRVVALLEQAPTTVLLAGSCGLQLLTALQLPLALRTRLAVFAYGPVCNAPATFGQLCVIQGSGDWISRAVRRRARSDACLRASALSARCDSAGRVPGLPRAGRAGSAGEGTCALI